MNTETVSVNNIVSKYSEVPPNASELYNSLPLFWGGESFFIKKFSIIYYLVILKYIIQSEEINEISYYHYIPWSIW